MSAVDKSDSSFSGNILVVDDDPAILRLLTHLLEQGGHRVRTATDGNQALHLILQDCPDVLVTDWMMPGLDGLELCRRVRHLYQRKVLPHYTNVLLLTNQGGKSFYIEGLEAGADDFIEKSAESLSDLRIEIRARIKAAIRTRKLELDYECASHYDGATRLLNRSTFFEQGKEIWERSIRNKFPLSAVLFDCDFFKRINDIHGFQGGDAVLGGVAEVLRGFSRTTDIVGRFGGDEFCILLPGCNEATARGWAERIRNRFASTPVHGGKLEIGLTSSFGIAQRNEQTRLFDELIDRADTAMLAAKNAGRNRCMTYSEAVAIDTDASSAGTSGSLRTCDELLDDVTVGKVMTPLTLSVGADATPAYLAELFLQSGVEAIPVVGAGERLIGVVWDRALFGLIGNAARWNEPLGDLITPSVVSYPLETPLRVLFETFCRTPFPQFWITQDDVPVGTITRALLLRWLRLRWTAITGAEDRIMPGEYGEIESTTNKIVHSTFSQLGNTISNLIALFQSPADNKNRLDIAARIARCQDLLDRLSAIKRTDTASGNQEEPESSDR